METNNNEHIGEEDEFHGKDPAEEEAQKKEKAKCFNKERIKDLKDAWVQYNLHWGSAKENIPLELDKIIEEIIFRLEE